MDKAWKNEILEGSIPVGPGGITTSMGDKIPTLAGASTLLASIIGFKEKTDSSENTNPTFSANNPLKLSN